MKQGPKYVTNGVATTITTYNYTPDMLSVEEARDRVLSAVPLLNAEELPILQCLGQVLAQNAATNSDIPPWDNSAMDGYAVRHRDIAGAAPDFPKTLAVIGQLPAGRWPDKSVMPHTAIRLMTGSPIPDGADTVVPFEDTDELYRKNNHLSEDEISIHQDIPKGGSVRPAAEDAPKGKVILRKGAILGPSEIGLLATMGYATIKVFRKPVIAILATGDELLSPPQPLEPGKIYDSNSYSISALVNQYGGIAMPLGIAEDSLESINRMLDQGLVADMLITSAGVSKGDYDIVKDILAKRGKINFWSVRMRPAKPIAFGVIKGPKERLIPILGLPGNPVSAMIAFEQLGRPALLRMQGHENLEKPTIQAILEDSITNNDGRRVYARVVVTETNGNYYAKLTGPQGSNILTSMSKANGLAICPEHIQLMEKGKLVQVQMLNWI